MAQTRIAFSGSMGSGKTSMAKAYARYRGDAQILSFATPVKNLARDFFGSITKDRLLLQKIGTSLREIDEDVWVNLLLRGLDENAQCILVDDLRFENEAVALRNAGFTIVYLDVSQGVQEDRLRALYGEKSAAEHRACMGHVSEQQEQVKSMADVVLCTDHMSSTDIISSLSSPCVSSCVSSSGLSGAGAGVS